MNDKTPEVHIHLSSDDASQLSRPDENRFTAEMDLLAQEAETMRMAYMERRRKRSFIANTISTLLVMAGAGGFGWYFLMEFNLGLAVLCMIAAIIPPPALYLWAGAPLKAYIRDYKKEFLPKVAQILGGFKFHPSRGISAQIISKTGVLPKHNVYEAEDCFMGTYKGVRVLFSEARLYERRNGAPVFDGVFVLLKIPAEVIEGHTIITADIEMAQKSAATRWQKLQPVTLSAKTPYAERFRVFSDKPEDADLMIGEKLLKELAEAADVFDKAKLTAVLFRKQYVFMAIPYKLDMFEPSNMFVPVAMKEHAMSCKKEIEQILEIIDVFDLYQAGEKKADEAPGAP